MVRAPGVEPGLAGWEPAVITTRPCSLDFLGSVVDCRVIQFIMPACNLESQRWYECRDLNPGSGVGNAR